MVSRFSEDFSERSDAGLAEPLDSPTQGLYVLIDGPSIDGTLGRVIDAPPGPETRPDWRRLEGFVKQECGPAPYEATFVMWAPGQEGFMHFLRSADFMIALGDRYTQGQSCADLIRERVTRLNAATDPQHEWHVIVGTHNPDLIRELPQLADRAERIIVFGFTEYLPEAPELEGVIDFYDIEDDARLFRMPLPRPEPEDEDRESSYRTSDSRVVYSSAATPEPMYERSVAQDLGGSEDLGLQFSRDLNVDSPAPVAAKAPRPPVAPGEERDFYLIVDGRSMEWELGEVLGQKPEAETRPDWSKVLEYARGMSRSVDGEVKALFAHIGPGHPGFRRALRELGYASIPVNLDEEQPSRPVVEEYVCGLLRARVMRGEGEEPGPPPDIMVVGHGEPLFQALSDLPDDGQRLLALGFPERMPRSEGYERVEQMDLERDCEAFAVELPRDFGVDVDDFDPDDELSRLF